MSKLSIIIPTFNEIKLGLIPTVLKQLADIRDVEVIVSDGGSEDETVAVAQRHGARVIGSHSNSRAQRLNLGAQEAKGDFLLFHHPRSIIETKGVEFLVQNRDSLKWGGFTHSFDVKHPLLSFTSWYSNNIRGAIFGILYLDHGIFMKKSVFEKAGPIPPVDIFEDTLLSQAMLNVLGKPAILPFLSRTSAVRFTKNGVCKQALINQYLKLMFYLGSDHRKMNKLYEEELALNSRYQSKEKK